MENGLITAVTSSVIGLVTSAVVSAVLPASMSGTGNGLVVLFNLFSILVGIGSLQRAKYWGILYSVGYFSGILLIGKYFMAPGNIQFIFLLSGYTL